MEVDPRLLRYLRAIDEHGTFTRAAESERISQPALTAKIGLLERQLDAKLIDRGRYGARLNAVGKLLLRHARMIDNTVALAAREVALTKSGDMGPLVIGATPISTIELLPKALDTLDREGAKSQITIIEADDDVLLDKLISGDIEIMLGGPITGRSTPDVVQEHLADFPLCVVVGRKSQFWGSEGVYIDDLVQEPWALPASGSVIRSYVDAIFVGAGQNLPTSYWSCAGMGALKSVVRQSHRVAVMPSHAILMEVELGLLHRIPLLSPSSSRRTHILRRNDAELSPLGKQLIDNLHLAAQEIPG